MKLDLLQDQETLQKHLRQRVRNYSKCVHEGPGEDDAPVRQITFGYSFDQAGWMAVVFDTRIEADIDGEWNTYIEDNQLELPHWNGAFDRISEGRQVPLVKSDGSTSRLGPKTTTEEFAKLLGEMIRDVAIEFHEKGGFNKVPMAEDCILVVEEHEGFYAWISSDAEESDTEEAYLARLAGDVAAKPVDQQIDHWIGVLDRLASGRLEESDWSFRASNHAIERLEAIGEEAIVPMLKFVLKWSTKPEFAGDRPNRKIEELPMQTPVVHVLMWLHDSDKCVAQAESLLRQIVRRSVKVNEQRRLWGIVPAWAARCLHRSFPGYPRPKLKPSTNELKNRDQFITRRVKQ